ncbi:GntR family transcriptional regulator [Allorhizocola rhizosphaerae]|uniref:GntR family transcriptional regulator n=1 Tax=Allorhizocola rhizosphaerae TaxID=1872709 RepID=UPI000E3B7AE2|nr:PLP-dependent aminotransferase family protein [Allorhizocola rhizosphaerae]
MRYQAELLTFPVVLRRDGAVPLREQLAGQIAAAIDSGAVVCGMRMPSIRTLADELGISRGVVVAAYDILHGQGHLEIRRGAGAFVQTGRSGAVIGYVDLMPGRAVAFPVRAWRAAWHHASLQSGSAAAPGLLRALAEHLGWVPQTHDIVVTAGAGAGLRAALSALGCGGPTVALEEPGAPEMWRAVPGGIPLPRTGPVGLDGGVRTIVVSPNGSFPTGRVLSERDRLVLADWSRGGGGYLVEMAEDTVLRRDLAGLPRLIDTAARDRVIVVGGFERVLSPALKVGYVIAPRDIADLIAQRVDQPGHLLQLVAAHLIADGALARQMQRLTRLHTQKRSIVDSTLRVRGRCPCTALLPVPAGMTAVSAASAAAGRGIGVQTLDRYYYFGRRPVAQALVLGYSHLPDNVLRYGLRRLQHALHG